DGDIDPSQLTQALARRARQAGAEIYRFNPVEAIDRKPNGEWLVHTRNGDITCEAVVNATGYRVNEVGRMLGVEHPVVSMEHQYFLTEPIAELEAMDRRVPIIRDPGDDFYSRQEKFGLLVGIYEQGCKTWGLDGIDPSFTMELCPNDLDRLLDNMERVFERLPVLTETGITRTINGPITYSADGLPLIGKIPGLRDAYACLGLRAGIGEGGGHGKLLAEIIVHGEAEWDTWALDPRRFTGHCNTAFTALKAIEDYQNEFRFHMPHEHRPAGRCAKTTPLYPVLKTKDAAFGVVAGWERALFYKPSPEFIDRHSFRFTPTEEVVALEVKAVQERVGLMEVSGFTRFEIAGPQAADW
ncbi:MAG: FAD-dependent oxidoreductase, partial [Kiloniellales bacterium]|nr:FAD-dependent oxidoreductase [Kiloniellales bacterium]